MESEADTNGSAEQVAVWKIQGGCDKLELIKDDEEEAEEGEDGS